MDFGERGVISLWDMLVMLSPFATGGVALGVAKSVGGGGVRYTVAMAVALAFTGLSIIGSRFLGRRAAEIANSGVRVKQRLPIVYGAVAVWGFVAVPIATILVVGRVLRLVTGAR
jgi:hypothetical protein